MSILLPDYHVDYVGQPNKDFVIKRAVGGEDVTAETLSSGEADLLSVGLDVISICLLWRLRETTDPILFF